LRLVAKENKHAKADFYDAVMRSMREKVTSTDAQFKRYLEVLLGDKDQEKVLEIVSKVDKSVRRGGDAANDNFSRRGRGRSDRRSVECYNTCKPATFHDYQTYLSI
jgi:hypothetical protein